MRNSSDHSALNFFYTSGRSDFLKKSSARRFWPIGIGQKPLNLTTLDLVFTGNAFEAPARTRHQRSRRRRRGLHRVLRELVLWLMQPSFFTRRAPKR